MPLVGQDGLHLIRFRRTGEEVANEIRKRMSLAGEHYVRGYEGGDAMTIGRSIYVRRSGGRVTPEGLKRFSTIANSLSYKIVTVDVAELPEVVHLSSVVSYAGVLQDKHTVVLNAKHVDENPFLKEGLNIVRVTPKDTSGTNVLAVKGHLLVQEECTELAAKLSELGAIVEYVAWSEFLSGDSSRSTHGHFSCCCVFLPIIAPTMH